MAVTDSIADALTIIRNGSSTGKEKVDIKASRQMAAILAILKAEGFIENVKTIEDKKQGVLRVYLSYQGGNKKLPVITNLRRISTPGKRVYVDKTSIPRVMNGVGTALISTSKGLMTDRQARQQEIGGEVICYVW